MWKKVIYRDKNDNNKRKVEWFKIQGSKNKQGMTIDRKSEFDSIVFTRQEHVEYLGSFYKLDKE